ncbi:MAG: YraN family protein [Nitrospirota bacterium]|nr:YraN family protein [Nitrospirota bacterium]
MSLLSKLLGRSGEDSASRFLAGQGYRILERNFRIAAGEIDLIAMDRDTIVFVEVKTRTSDAYGAPELAVDTRKQARMTKAALAYLAARKLHQMPCRFDIVAITRMPEERIELIRNAFETRSGFR